MSKDNQGRFVDDDDEDDEIRLNVIPVQAEAGEKRLITYGQLDKRRIRTTQLNIKCPNEVLDFIEAHTEKGATVSLIIARMLLIGKEQLQKELLTGDVEVKF